MKFSILPIQTCLPTGKIMVEPNGYFRNQLTLFKIKMQGFRFMAVQALPGFGFAKPCAEKHKTVWAYTKWIYKLG